MPTQITLGGFPVRLDAGLPGPAVERLETIARVISFCQPRGRWDLYTRRRKTHGGEVLLRLFQCGAERRRVAMAPPPEWIGAATTTPVSRSTACSGGLKAKWLRKPSFIRAIFASGSVGLVQSSFRKLLALPLAIQSDQIVDRRRLDATFLRHARQHLAIGLASVATNDGSQRGVGASIVEPSTPIRSPFTRPRSATRARTQPNTFS